jgi:YD repeat-containing protein
MYNQREYYQPLTFYYSNLGARWTFSWLSYLEDDPANPGTGSINLAVRGGGRESYSGFAGGVSTPNTDSRVTVALVSASPIKYERRRRDGAIEVFSQPDGAISSPRKVFLTQIIDRRGNALTFTYDAQLRLVSATDAIGQVTTLSYELVADPLKITKVTGPFGRSAVFEYNESGPLTRTTRRTFSGSRRPQGRRITTFTGQELMSRSHAGIRALLRFIPPRPPGKHREND